MTQRIYDENGWLFIPKNPISKAGVFPYLGSEIRAPEPNKIYQVLRSPEELIRTAETFKLLPIIDEHELLGSLGTSTDERHSAGTTGEIVEYEHPYLFASLKITSDKLQREIAGGKIELSPAYTCDWVKENGIFEGVKYDYKQIIKHGNHLALVEKGRTGPDVAVLDHYAFDSANSSREGNEEMNFKEILESIEKLTDEERASLLSALMPEVVEIVEESAEAEKEKTDELDEEEAEDEDKKKEVEDEDKKKEVEDEDKKKEVEDEVAAERAKEGEGVKTDDELAEKIAKDSISRAIKFIDERNRMISRVKPFIGAVPQTAMDSAETVASYTLKKFGVKHKKNEAVSVINGFLHGRKPASSKNIAQDKALTFNKNIDISKFGWEK